MRLHIPTYLKPCITSIFIGLCTFLHTASATRYFVSNAGNDTNDGLTWLTPKKNIYTVFLLAVSGDEVWVQRGRYLPSAVEDANAQLVMPAGVKLYGGFSGSEILLTNRDTALLHTINKTVLSGDMNNDDTPTARIGTNSNTLILAANGSSNLTIDGFVISGAAGSNGALYCLSTSALHRPKVLNCRFEMNALAVQNISVAAVSNPSFTSCKFLNNGTAISNFTASTAGANIIATECNFYNNTSGAVRNTGGIACDNAMFFTDCNFANNAATSGGAIYTSIIGSGNHTFTRCNFMDNTATNDGGAVYYNRSISTAVGSPTFISCSFLRNSATNGGAIYQNGTTTSFSKCSLQSNTATITGGAVAIAAQTLTNSIATTFNNCTLSGNTAANGGAVHQSSTAAQTLNFNNTLLTGNSATGTGSAILLANNAGFCTLRNSVVSGNKATAGAAVSGGSATRLLVQNSIFWANNANIDTDANLINNIIQDGWLGTGSTNIADNPLFLSSINYANAPTVSGNFRVKICSPAANTGKNTNAPAASLKDLDDNTRLANATVDIGAYELISTFKTVNTANTNYIATSECDGNDGWTHYYSGANWLVLSMKKNGNTAVGHNIGSVGSATTPVKVAIKTTPAYHFYRGANLSTANYITHTGADWYSMNYFWNVEPNEQPDAAAPVTVRFYYSASDLYDLTQSVPAAATDLSKIKAFKVSHPYSPLDIAVPSAAFTQFDYSASGSSTNAWTGGNFQNMTYAEFQVTSFSGGSLGASNGSGILPVELLRFDAKKVNRNDALLNWATASEKNNAYFTIERSEDAQNFSELQRVKGAGDSRQQQNYTFTDFNLRPNIYYYRLKQTDYDGQFTYSDIVTVNVIAPERVATVTIYPNPAQNHLTIETDLDRNQAMFVYNEQGQCVRNYNNIPTNLDISQLINGVYFIRISSEMDILRFIKM